jgi:hypothetical protein
MHPHSDTEHSLPTRLESTLFYLKSRVFITRRWWEERSHQVAKHHVGEQLRGAPQIGHAKASLWTQVTPEEFPLTAGKVQNLRMACRYLHRVEIPAGEVFSFWRQLGRTTRKRGFVAGRELRSGCLVPNLGGGLCQLSGLLHAAALNAGLEVVERHEHSRLLPGTSVDPERDATVFWNYVDLRFKAPFDWRLEVYLTATDLVVSIRAADAAIARTEKQTDRPAGNPIRATADGDCLTCGVTACFRHPSATRQNAASSGHSAWLLDGMWPEFDDWCRRHALPGDHWLIPLDGNRWKKPNYAWNPPPQSHVHHATFETLRRSFQQRRLPAQGAVRQRFLLESQRKLADHYAHQLDPQARHLVVSQTLLPHLWRAGHLGGRTFDVLVNRWPLAELQQRLDDASNRHTQSDTLADFRADEALVNDELDALSAAARIITPHRAISRHFGSRALELKWRLPDARARKGASNDMPLWFFPASALGRKGVYELAAAMKDMPGELLVLGRAHEGSNDPLADIPHRQGSIGELDQCTALILPAWIEHEPRIALRALASRIPVIATTACGLPQHPLLKEVRAGDSDALREAMAQCIEETTCSATC